MDVNPYPSHSGRDMMAPQQPAGNSWIYSEAPQKHIASIVSIPANEHTEDKENVAPQLGAKKLAASSKAGGSPSKAHKRQPLRDVTHMYCPGATKGAVRKVSGLRSMR